MKRMMIVVALCLSVVCASAAELRFADVLTDNMVLQRGKDVRCWGTAPAGSKVEVLLTQSRDELVKFAGEESLNREVVVERAAKEVPGIGKVKLAYIEEEPVAMKPVTKTVSADKDGRWEVTLGTHAASFTPTYLAARAGEEKVAIQNLLIGEVWIASGQSNMEWAWTRDKMWENKGLILNGVRYAKVRGASTAPRESFVDGPTVKKGSAFEPWIVCEDGAVDRVSTVAYLFAQYLHRRLKVPVGIINIAQGGSFAREWCSRELLEKMESPTVDALLADYDEKQAVAQAVGWRGGPTELYNARLYPIRKMTTAGVIYMQGENEALCGAVPQYWKTFPGVIQSYREALGEPDLPFGIITLQGYGGYQTVREIHYEIHKKTPNTGYIVAHDIGGNIHPSWKRPLCERAVYWALRDVYKVIGGKQLQFKDAGFADGKASVRFESVELKNGGWSEPKPAKPWTNDQQSPAGFEIAGEDHVWYRAKIAVGGSAEEGLILSNAMVPEPVAVRYAWCKFPCGNLGSWENPLPPFRSDDWPVIGEDIVPGSKAGELSESEKNYLKTRARKNRGYELGLRLAVAEFYENMVKRHAHPKGMMQEAVTNMKGLMQVFDAEKAEEIAPGLGRHALHRIPTRYWRRDRYSPARRAKWGWLIERVLRLPDLPKEMEEAVSKKGVQKQLAKVQEALIALDKEIDKLDDPKDMDFDEMLDKVLAVMEKEKVRLAEEEGKEFKWGGELNKNPF